MSTKSSRKRSRAEEEEGTTGSSAESDEILFWKKNYNEMKKLKEDAEADLVTEKQIRTSSEELLKDSADWLKQKQSESNDSSVASVPTSSDSSKPQDTERLLKIIAFYETMTSMTVKMKEGDRYCCTVKNPGTRQAARFFISNSTENGELLYEPSANAELFPSYMNEESLSFVPEIGPVLLGDAIASLFVNDESEEEGDEEESEHDE
mmetsp:Transcript_35727/g.66718  ORF Transcript_35727/g.66718 Transcript_35727/m.66718 type:complete len:207 (+) Transcript_35727:45-665(+)